MKRQDCDNGGFTLVELLISLVIFSIGILAVGSMQLTSMKGNTQAVMMTEGLAVAEDKMEELLTLAYDGPELDVGDHEETVDNNTINWSVTEDTSRTYSLKDILLSVTWSEKGQQKSVELRSLRAE
ncbi:hypothetical protein DESUT3_40780 [Desulfuromonas versatilis]|uniref:Prepilin-type N-terminal cleavage/methylation domain-containing protein n=1 Tax=Desulfuromonas versatilis TaxID=2802975 RepID=A0ABM8HYE7_9BACT|nr:prepilin-type N-terminal cleavage/methylation domain-containing protein [Desulfuromonas versatilis]BCR07009.1 hypothetical protein DESUT3_40780 [Desulfuromonas versatilis]